MWRSKVCLLASLIRVAGMFPGSDCWRLSLAQNTEWGAGWSKTAAGVLLQSWRWDWGTDHGEAEGERRFIISLPACLSSLSYQFLGTAQRCCVGLWSLGREGLWGRLEMSWEGDLLLMFHWRAGGETQRLGFEEWREKWKSVESLLASLAGDTYEFPGCVCRNWGCYKANEWKEGS